MSITKDEWDWLRHHPLWGINHGHWDTCVIIMPMFVDPATGECNDDESKNTVLHVWIEGGPNVIDNSVSSGFVCGSHDYLLDAGGATLGEALAAFAANVRRVYGDGTERLVTA